MKLHALSLALALGLGLLALPAAPAMATSGLADTDDRETILIVSEVELLALLAAGEIDEYAILLTAEPDDDVTARLVRIESGPDGAAMLGPAAPDAVEEALAGLEALREEQRLIPVETGAEMPNWYYPYDNYGPWPGYPPYVEYYPPYPVAPYYYNYPVVPAYYNVVVPALANRVFTVASYPPAIVQPVAPVFVSRTYRFWPTYPTRVVIVRRCCW
jgi:hypothetical protein